MSFVTSAVVLVDLGEPRMGDVGGMCPLQPATTHCRIDIKNQSPLAPALLAPALLDQHNNNIIEGERAG